MSRPWSSRSSRDLRCRRLRRLIEHLRDPQAFLTRAPLLRPEGRLLLSTPNIANWAMRLSLLFGRFRYTEWGILDRTHTHLFTRKTLDECLEAAGYRVTTSTSPSRCRWSPRRGSRARPRDRALATLAVRVPVRRFASPRRRRRAAHDQRAASRRRPCPRTHRTRASCRERTPGLEADPRHAPGRRATSAAVVIDPRLDQIAAGHREIHGIGVSVGFQLGADHDLSPQIVPGGGVPATSIIATGVSGGTPSTARGNVAVYAPSLSVLYGPHMRIQDHRDPVAR